MPHLMKAFNECLQNGEFPENWKIEMTVILRKAAKEDYSNPNAYRPIALLNTLGKLFERIINDRLVHWAERSGAIAQGHMGGQKGHNINNALVLLTSWMKPKWQEGKIATRTFLDVESAYPTVHKERLIHTLCSKGAPNSLVVIINSFLSNRHTKIKLNDFISDDFSIQQGIPQGSPLSVSLYLIYNSSLLLPNPPNLKEDQLSIA
ncbi:hypothetical protein O181_065307 [Austropuccinia psidii MF-1]|uniref:Reverse transcriptase domain-containing protein n=1 Tax=Austropuccinia psidii MF-1 TaxID=1389203 RepID=A0A9Q3ET85_9BASI|nr:hypothetical protein [Austropuccinia psidii MF-1]